MFYFLILLWKKDIKSLYCILAYSDNKNTKFILYINKLKFIEFIKINDGGIINYPIYESEKSSHDNFEDNIISDK